MNRIIVTDNGGQPIYRKDITFLTNMFLEALKGAVSEAGDDFKISGCEVDDPGDDWNCSEGFICLKGEIYFVAAHSIVKTQGHTYYFDVVETWDQDGYKEFYDLTYHNCWQIKRAKLYSSATPPANYMAHDAENRFMRISDGLVADTVADKCNQKLYAYQNSWTLVTSEFLNNFENFDTDTYFAMAYRKNSLGKVELRGAVRKAGSNINVESADIMTLPSNFRPTKSMTIACVCVFQQFGNDATWYHTHITILPDGTVKFINSASIPYYWATVRLEIHAEFPI